MKKNLSIVMLLILVAFFGNMDQVNAQVNAQGTPLGHFINVYDGHETPQYAVCAGSGEDCIGGDVKTYPGPLVPILT